MDEATVCIANIGPRGRAQRMRFGLIVLALAVIAGIALLATGASRPWRLLVFLPMWMSAIGVFQAKEHT